MSATNIPAIDIGSRCEFRTYYKTVRTNGETVVKRVTDPFKGDDNIIRHDDDSYALVVEREYGNKPQAEGPGAAHGSVRLKVNSPHLLAAFRRVIKSYPTVSSDFSRPFRLKSPFQMLMHWWDELDAYRKEAEDAVVRMHLNLLFEFLNFELGPAREKIMATVRGGQITYFNAWVLFRPGDLVYTKVLGEPWLLRCQKTAYEVSTSRGPYLEVHCTFTDHDGTDFGEAKHNITIYQKRQFGQENPAVIVELPVFPRRFVPEGEPLEEKLIKRGKRFLAYSDVSVQEYDGIAHFLKEPPFSYWHPDMADFDGIWLPYTESGRVILDRKTFSEDQHSNQPTVTKVAQPDPLLCPPYAVGYSLSRKDWCRFLVDNISPPRWKQGVWDSLVIPDRQKLILRGLVTSHEYPSNARNQPEQKGKGLVILLHGTPGSGKTLSAETAAEGTQKALVSTSLGQLNRDNIPWAFEWRLKQLFQYATTWKAVVLLDEADVFLAARDLTGGGDKKHNSMVAIFLRELEYFSGICFLTTNILLSFDEAIRSRIHLALGFDPPGSEIRRRIWTQSLRKIPTGEIHFEDSGVAGDGTSRETGIGEMVRRLERHELNGREISNAVNTARTIAKFQGERLSLGHIEDVLGVRKEFDKRIKDETRSLRKKSHGSSAAARFGPGLLLRQNSIVSAEPEEYVDDE